MSKREPTFFLFDIFVAIIKIEYTVKNFNSPESLKYDYLAWDSVIREFEIIGEATKHLIKLGLLDEENQIIVDFRNLLIHHYFGIDAEAVWNVVKQDLGKFKDVIEYKIMHTEEEVRKHISQSFVDENNHLDFMVKELQKF